MRVVAYNILEGGRGRLDPLAEVLRATQAQIILVAEAWEKKAFFKLGDRLGMEALHAEHPTNEHGHVGLLTNLHVREFINLGSLQTTLTRAALMAVLEEGDRQIGVMGVHLHARESFADEGIRCSEIANLLEHSQAWRDAQLPHLIGGDFNATHPQQLIDLSLVRPKTHQRVEVQGNVFPRDAISQILAAGYVDTQSVGRQGSEFDTSFTTRHPAMRVDYIFASPQLSPLLTEAHIVKNPLARYASDHYPVMASF